jgi:hypothetical protein
VDKRRRLSCVDSPLLTLAACRDAGNADPGYQRPLRRDIAKLDLLLSYLTGDCLQAAAWIQCKSPPTTRPQPPPAETGLTATLGSMAATAGSGLFGQDSWNVGFMLMIDQALLPQFQRAWLRLVDRLRATLRLVLIRVLSALSRRPAARSFVLVLLAASRCFGRRAEPSDHALPALISMSVVTGAAARSA